MIDQECTVFAAKNEGDESCGFHPLHFVRPAGRTYLEVRVLYTPGKGKC
jgi:hypothetical protein